MDLSNFQAIKPEYRALAFDLGGTKVSAAVITPAGEILGRQQEPTCQDGPKAGIRQMIRMGRKALEDSEARINQVTCLGVGIPAVLEPGSDEVIWAPKLAGWRDVSLRTALQEALGMPAYLEYDGHTAVLGEWWLGSGQGYQSLVEVIIGTGIGGGMILDGRLYRGYNRLAGTAGWSALTTEFDRQSQEAANFGFFDSLASGPGLVRYARELSVEFPDSHLWELCASQELTPVHIFHAARQGDALAQQVLDHLAGWLGLGIANILSLVNPQIVILGGGIGSQCAELLPRIRQVAKRWAQPISGGSCQLAISKLGPEAGLLGAACSAWLRWLEDQKKIS